MLKKMINMTMMMKNKKTPSIHMRKMNQKNEMKKLKRSICSLKVYYSNELSVLTTKSQNL
jgi:hypothetical protein